ncbi:cytochrome P450 [Cupriavidus taiwanensis]|uniref:cytochrome P450 n=1 Tax=Cupriavidus taiwanensis TaxID=164546 RepID=UPI000E14897D|nr:cytochrome P450 [Cupriavidus taiwanensis]SPC20181.1 putative cytochrome P450 family protein [Cupriavidus taiwanensis]
MPQTITDPFADIDPFSAVTHPDPYPYYRELAATRPFFREQRLGLWIAAGWSEVAAVLAHPDCRVRPPAQPVPPSLAGTAAGDLFGRLIRMNDGAAHAPLKALLMPMLAAVAPGVAAQKAAAMAQVLDAGEGAHVAMPAASVNLWLFALPVVTVAAVLGLPVARDRGTAVEVAQQVAAFAAAQSPLADADTVRAGAEAARWLGTWLASSLASGVAADGPLSALQHAAQAAGIDAQAVAANIIGLLVQACEATAGLAGNTLLWLGRNPSAGGMPLQGVVARVAQDDPPVQNTRRFLAADTQLCGHAVKAGDTVLVLLAAASTSGLAGDARAWTFGQGRHACPGDRLAQALAGATVAALCARGADPAALARAFRYRPSQNARIPHFL